VVARGLPLDMLWEQGFERERRKIPCHPAERSGDSSPRSAQDDRGGRTALALESMRVPPHDVTLAADILL